MGALRSVQIEVNASVPWYGVDLRARIVRAQTEIAHTD
jgi:hypothetical protein